MSPPRAASLRQDLRHRVRWSALPYMARTVGEDAARLIPPPHEGWRQAVRAYHNEQFRDRARDHGVPFDIYINDAVHRVRNWAATARVRIRMDYGILESFLQEGRYKNQFDTGTSNGVVAPGPRMLIEHTALGIPPSARARHRPVYGYCTGSRELSPQVLQYGDVVLELRPEINHRTTFTFGDSLDMSLASAQPPFCPRPLSRPSTLALDGGFDLRATTELWEATCYGYIEAQVFGLVGTRDVATVIFTLDLRPTKPMKQMMGQLGINWRTVPGDEP